MSGEFFAKTFNLVCGQPAITPARNPIQAQKSIADSFQSADRMTKFFAHAPHLAVASFVNSDFEPRMPSLASHMADLGGSGHAILELKSSFQFQSVLLSQTPPDPDQVGFPDFMTGMSQLV